MAPCVTFTMQAAIHLARPHPFLIAAVRKGICKVQGPLALTFETGAVSGSERRHLVEKKQFGIA